MTGTMWHPSSSRTKNPTHGMGKTINNRRHHIITIIVVVINVVVVIVIDVTILIILNTYTIAQHSLVRRLRYDMRDQLHWFPIRQLIDFKIAVFVHNALHGRGPAYLSCTCNPVREASGLICGLLCGAI